LRKGKPHIPVPNRYAIEKKVNINHQNQYKWIFFMPITIVNKGARLITIDDIIFVLRQPNNKKFTFTWHSEPRSLPPKEIIKLAMPFSIKGNDSQSKVFAFLSEDYNFQIKEGDYVIDIIIKWNQKYYKSIVWLIKIYEEHIKLANQGDIPIITNLSNDIRIKSGAK